MKSKTPFNDIRNGGCVSKQNQLKHQKPVIFENYLQKQKKK